MNLSSKQLEFLKNELNITERDFSCMTEEKWKKIREDCFNIETDELLDIEESGEEESERCLIATSIADVRFSQLKIETE